MLPSCALTGLIPPSPAPPLPIFCSGDTIENLVLLAKSISFYYQFETKRNPSFSPRAGCAYRRYQLGDGLAELAINPRKGLNRNFILRSIGAPPKTQRNEIPKTRERSRSSCRHAHNGDRKHARHGAAKGQNRRRDGSLRRRLVNLRPRCNDGLG